MTVTDRTDATEQREAAVVEEVARAIGAERNGLDLPLSDDEWEYHFREDERDDLRRYAAAAVAAYRATDGGAVEAVRRVRDAVAKAGPMMPRAAVRRALDGNW